MTRPVIFLFLLIASPTSCSSDGDGDADADGDIDADEESTCLDDGDCDDGLFCTGDERCDPESGASDDQGCVQPNESPCSSDERCVEAEDRCEVDDCDEADGDGDGHARLSCGGDDCDDDDANQFPGNLEVCDEANHDEDCDVETYGFRDDDVDGSIDDRCCNVSAGGELSCGEDCDDSEPATRGGNSEICDGLDNDCDGEIDEGVLDTFWVDGDGDGYGSSADGAMTVEGCSAPAGYSADPRDCDDDDEEIHPAAVERCDGDDNNCDGSTDPGCDCTDGESVPCGVDLGACEQGTQLCVDGRYSECTGGQGPVAEVCNGEDDDCDGETDEGLLNTYYRDADSDGFGDPDQTILGCTPPEGSVSNATDCDDTEAAVNPGALEICDGVENNCDSVTDPDCDCLNGETIPCGSSVGECSLGTELCVDGRYGECTGGQEPVAEVCNGLDDDCDGEIDDGVLQTYYLDDDDDGFGDASTSTSACSPPPNYVADSTDCDDSLATVHPGAVEICDRLDSDCSSGGGVRPAEDVDGDGHAPLGTALCTGGPLPADDCNDEASNVHPGQTSYLDERTCPPRSSWCESLGCCGDDFSIFMPCTRASQCISEPLPFDYNCNGVEEPQPSWTGTCRPSACAGGGPVYAIPPPCGADVEHHTCAYLIGSCVELISTAPMPCR